MVGILEIVENLVKIDLVEVIEMIEREDIVVDQDQGKIEEKKDEEVEIRCTSSLKLVFIDILDFASFLSMIC